MPTTNQSLLRLLRQIVADSIALRRLALLLLSVFANIRLGTSSTDEWHWNRGALITYFSNQARSAGNAFLNAPDNNGNVTMQEHYVPTDDAISSYSITLRDTYDYDYLNRTKRVDGLQRNTAGSWLSIYGQCYTIDR